VHFQTDYRPLTLIELFNVFLNDIFNFVKENKLYNYADDNTLSHPGSDLNGLVKSLEKESAILIHWLTFSNLKSTHCTLLILLIINLVTKQSLCIVSKVQSIKLFAPCGTLKVQREQ
jgi:hypothetical protein